MVSGFLGDDYFDLSDYFTLNGEEIIAKIKGFIKPITDYISGISWDGIWSGVENSIDWVIAQFEWLYEVLVGSSIIPDLVTDIMSWVDKLEFKGIKGLLDNVVGWFKDMYSDIMGGTRQLATAFVNPFKAIGDSAKKMGKVIGGAFDKALAKSPMVNKALGGLRNAFVAVKVDAQAMGVHTAGLAIEQIKQVAATIKQKRELQKLIQVYRELNVAYVDDLENLKSSSGQQKLVMENSSKWQKKIIQSNIDRYKTLGREIGNVNKATAEMEYKKLTRELGKKIKGRGFISRFMFGDGTLLTWESKIQGLMGRIGGLFDKLGQKILTSVTKLQLLKTTAGEAKLAATQAAAAQTQATARSGLSGAKSAVKVTQEVSGVKDPTKSVSKKSIAILKKLQATANQWNKALNLADTELRAANEAMAKSGKNILKIRSGSTTLQKAMLLLGKGLGGAGSIFRLATEQLGKVIPKIKTGFGWLGSMGFKLINIGGILDGLKGSGALKIMTKIFKKVLIVFAIFDIYKGVTDSGRVQEILGKSKEQATAFELGISGVSNAIGNFFSGFAHLAGTVIGYLGGEHLAKYLEGVDLAPAIAKVFTGILALFKTIGNILGAIFSGGGGDESSFTKLVKVVGSILSWIVDFFVNTAQALEMLTSGDASGAWAMFAKSFEGIFDGIISGITAAIMYIPNMIGSAISDMFMSVVTR